MRCAVTVSSSRPSFQQGVFAQVPLVAVVELPVPLDPAAPALLHQVMGRRQRPNPGEEGVRRLHETQGQILVERERRKLRQARIVGQQGLDLGSECEPRAVLGVEERLLPKVVAREQQPAAPPVPDGEGEHPPELGDHPLAVLLVEMDQRLGVGPGAELVALGHQRAAQLLVIVDLAVEHQQDAAIFVGHRLMAAGHVHDTEPPHPQPRPALDEAAPGVRAPVGDRVAHPADLGLADRAVAHAAADSAHVRPPFDPRPPACNPE
jgi:hypothetical protein